MCDRAKEDCEVKSLRNDVEYLKIRLEQMEKRLRKAEGKIGNAIVPPRILQDTRC